MFEEKIVKSQGENYKIFLQAHCGKTEKPTVIDKYSVKLIYWLISKKSCFHEIFDKKMVTVKFCNFQILAWQRGKQLLREIKIGEPQLQFHT